MLLAYVCGRIYCGDKPEFQKRKQKYYWRLGKGGRFQDGMLQALFSVKNLGGARQKNRDTTVPDGAELVDKWFWQPHFLDMICKGNLIWGYPFIFL